jgi:alpha-methylacyl-CoA racemase
MSAQPNMPMPELDGIVMLDLAGMGPSLRCVRALADLGARWIKLAPPSTAGRYELPWFVAGAFRGAEQFELDLKRPRGRDVFLRLASQADIVVEGFRPGVAKRLGIDYETLSKVNPRIVYAAVSGYGQDGPYSNWVGHDLNYQAMGGALAAAGRRRDGAPAMPGLTLADSAAGGWQAALLVTAALVARQSQGTGRFVDVATSEGCVHLASIFIDEHLGSGQPIESGNNILTGRYAWYDTYACADGGAVAVGAIEPKFFGNLCRALGLAHLIDKQWDDAAQPEIRSAFKAAFASKPRDAWRPLFDEVEACVTPVLSIAEVTRDAHWQARGMFCEFDHPEQGRRILGEFKFSEPEIRALKAEQVVR